ncbi:hypothetical protein [Micromonospora sp. WMMD1082]|uniref:hypothetical protein n=1 Tax=Micromonospora sp. WMMD1082 TaxID=3016104 RepID=UPI0024180B16|nr:hypothetical protein [Micromonospora sp. WMMD1082]MDG4796896.1 hypothetical protein [Micromonospora sp. WMMD1082]
MTRVGQQTWAALDVAGQRWVGRVPVVAPDPVQRRSLVRRTWAWRLLLAGWIALTGLAAWLAWRWLGPVGLGCPLLMGGPLLGLWWCSLVDLRQQADEMWGGR